LPDVHEEIDLNARGLSRRWGISTGLACHLVLVAALAKGLAAAEGFRWPGLYIISGYRTAAQQREVNPSFPASKHTRCPALAADLRIGDYPASVTPVEIWAFVGRLWRDTGGIWRGDTIDDERNHFEDPDVDDLPPIFNKP